MSITTVFPAPRTTRGLMRRINDLCASERVWPYHANLSQRDLPGWPDLCLVGRRLLFREVKTERTSPTPEQWAIGNQLLNAGQDWNVWRPRDWATGRIQQEVQNIGGLAQLERKGNTFPGIRLRINTVHGPIVDVDSVRLHWIAKFARGISRCDPGCRADCTQHGWYDLLENVIRSPDGNISGLVAIEIQPVMLANRSDG